MVVVVVAVAAAAAPRLGRPDARLAPLQPAQKEGELVKGPVVLDDVDVADKRVRVVDPVELLRHRFVMRPSRRSAAEAERSPWKRSPTASATTRSAVECSSANNAIADAILNT